jgi:AcrR family transcriptional regulator
MGKPLQETGQEGRKTVRRGHRKDIAREASIERILDAAEQLFAEYGYHGVTMKDIARKIGVSPTLLHYHFNGKESVFEAVWARKAPISARKRLAAMQHYAQTAGDAVTVEGALRIWIDTDLDLQIEQTDYWSAFGRIAARANGAGEWGSEKMALYWDPVALMLVEVLKKAMPGTSEERIFWGFHFTSGALTHMLARTGRLDRLSGGLCSSDDFLSIKEHMVDFMAAGFKAICLDKGTAEG